jgi:hypothetical protein
MLTRKGRSRTHYWFPVHRRCAVITCKLNTRDQTGLTIHLTVLSGKGIQLSHNSSHILWLWSKTPDWFFDAWCLLAALVFAPQFCTHSSFRNACYVLYSSHPPSIDNPNRHNIWRKAQTIKLIIKQTSAASCNSIPLRFEYSPQHPFLRHSQPMFLR